MKGLAEQNVAKAQYLRERLLELPDWEVPFEAPFFNEFVLRYTADLNTMNEALIAEGILPGLDLTPYGHKNCVLWCATEINTRHQIEHLIEVLARVASVVG